MATKTATKTNRNGKAVSKATLTKATKKNATVAKPTAKESKPVAKKLSQIDAAIQVLGKSKDPMNCKAMVEAMTTQKLWTSPGGATPDATLYASILREINAKGKDKKEKGGGGTRDSEIIAAPAGMVAERLKKNEEIGKTPGKAARIEPKTKVCLG